MQFISHNFYFNFVQSLEADDLNKELLTDEFAKLIVFKKPQLIEVVKSSGVPVSKNISDRSLVDHICKNLNRRLSHNIYKVIVKNNPDRGKGNLKVKSKRLNALQGDFIKRFKFNKGEQKQILKKIKMHKSNYIAMDGGEVVPVRTVIIKTVLITTAIYIGGYFLFRYIMKQYNKPDITTIEPTPPPAQDRFYQNDFNQMNQAQNYQPQI